MRLPTFDLDVLRTFVTGVEFNSFAKAADRLGRSTSAVSAQLKKLEEQVGTPVLAKAGRGLVLTPAGETLLSQARRLLELNDSIFSSLEQTLASGHICLGLQEDFGEQLLTDVLRRFTLSYPNISLEVRIARNAPLLSMVESGEVDLALAWEGAGSTPYATRLGDTPMVWVGPPDGTPLSRAEGTPLPLVMFDAPCILRSAATAALDKAKIPWRVTLTSPSVAGLWAAVSAGLGITLRTRFGLPRHLAVVAELPEMPRLGYVLHQATNEPAPMVKQLAVLIDRHLQESSAAQ